MPVKTLTDVRACENCVECNAQDSHTGFCSEFLCDTYLNSTGCPFHLFEGEKPKEVNDD